MLDYSHVAFAIPEEQPGENTGSRRQKGGYNVRVFGSVARNKEDETSDIDFLMTFRKGTTLFDRGGLIVDLREYLGCDVDVVSDKTVHPLIRDEVYHSANSLEGDGGNERHDYS